MPVRLTTATRGRTTSLILIGLLLCSWLLAFAIALWWVRGEALSSGMALSRTHARNFEEQFSQALQLIDLTAGTLSPGVGIDPMAELNQRLDTVVKPAHFLRSLSILDDKGKVVASSSPGNIGTTVPMNDFFPQVAADVELLRIGLPRRGRDLADAVASTTAIGPTDSALTPVLRRLPGPDQLTLVAALNHDYFANHADQLLSDAVGHVQWLRYDDVLLISSSPQDAPLTRGSAGEVGQLLLTKDQGELEQTLADGRKVLTAYRSSPHFPALLAVHLDRDAVLARFEAEARWLIAVVLPALLLLTAAIGLIWRRKLRTENELLEQRHLLKSLVRNIPDLLWLKDENGVYLACNSRFESFFGADEARIVGKTDYDFVDKELADSFHEHDLKAMQKGSKSVNEEWVSFASDGHRELLETTKSPIFDVAGRLIGVLGVGHDITARKQSEIQLMEALNCAKDANRARSLLIAAVNQSSTSIVIADAQARIVFVNRAFEQITGYRTEEVIGKNPRLLQSGQTKVSIYHDLWQKISLGQIWKGELQNRKKGGELHWELVSISPVNDDQGRLTHFVAVKEDITDKKREQVELIHAKNAAEAANVAKSQFLATMSHEIRTPMNGILGMAQLLLMPNLDDDERRDYARTILNSGQTLLTLLNDILDLSKVEAGKLELETGTVVPVQIIHETQTLFSEAAHLKGLCIEFAWYGPAQRYRGDPHRLRQMLANLVNNAIKFTQSGTIRIEAREVAHTGAMNTLEFAVIDTGIGIPADKKSLLFQPFSQADSTTTRQYGGSGLGLSIVKSLAKLMGGTTGLNSTPGQGSRFWFQIQAEVMADTDTRQVDRRSHKSTTTVSLLRQLTGHVLVVEDNPTNQKVIEALLHKLGLSTRIVENGQQVVDAIVQGDTADLILMDLQMPIMDGYAATTLIRRWEQDNNRSQRTIIALTADAFEEDRQHCLNAGMNDFISKPISFDALQTVLGKWLPHETAPSNSGENSTTSSAALDVPRIATLIAEIIPLLANNKFSVLERFKLLQDEVNGSEEENEMAELVQLLHEFRFDLVHERLCRIAVAQGWMETEK